MATGHPNKRVKRQTTIAFSSSSESVDNPTPTAIPTTITLDSLSDLAFTSSGTSSAATEPSVSIFEEMLSSLSPSQRHVVNLVMEGKNVFFTGSAGTGKSVALRAILQYVKDKCLRFIACAPTGNAALCLDPDIATTIHSAFGISPMGKFPNFVSARQKAKVKELAMLIIEEISMVSLDMLDHLDFICQSKPGGKGKPFGGIQVILCGDFAQLPPVPETKNAAPPQTSIPLLNQLGSQQQSPPPIYAFLSNAWKKLDPIFCELETVFRQQGDPTFVEFLQRARFGRLIPQDEIYLRRQCTSVPLTSADTTRLETTRQSVKDHNTQTLQTLDSTSAHWYKASFVKLVREACDRKTGDLCHFPFTGNPYPKRFRGQRAEDVLFPPFEITENAPLIQQLDVHQAPSAYRSYSTPSPYETLSKKIVAALPPDTESLELRIGARVVFCFNHPQHRLVNGSIGKIVGFTPPVPFSLCAISSSTPIPILNRVLSKHPSPTTKVPMVEASDSPNVAITGAATANDTASSSSSSSTNLLPTPPFTGTSLPVPSFGNKAVNEELFQYPIVDFGTPGNNYRIIDHHYWLAADENTGAVSCRIGLPIALAFAWTAHRCQGTTLTGKIHIDVNRTFTAGQAYVMASRTTQFGNMTIEPPKTDIRLSDTFYADPLVVAFYDNKGRCT